MCNSYLVVLVLPLCILFSLQCRGVTDRSIAVGIVGMKVVLTSDLLPCWMDILTLCGNKMSTRCNRWYLLQILLHAQHVSGCVSSLQAAACKPDTQPSAPHHTDNLRTKAPNSRGSDHLYNTLELLMMGIVLPETCWACNKYHLLHLVGILFPHNNDDARSKSLQIWQYRLLVTARSLYMYRTLSASFIRSTKNCSSSHWCMPWAGMIYIQ